MNIYVGNLPFSMTDAELTNIFSRFGEVTTARIVQDKFSGRSKGFGFVEMGSEDAGKAAISELDGTEHNGRPLKVNEARPKEDRPAGSRPPRRDGNGGGGGGYNRSDRGDRGDRRDRR